jgi:hypothetical protein
MSTDIVQRSFAGGELDPLLHGRHEIERYGASLATCRNFIIDRQGTASNRAGTRYVWECPTGLVPALIPFIFNNAESYAVEINDEFLTVRDGGAVTDTSSVGTWATTTAYTQGQIIADSSYINYYCYADHTSSAADEPGVGANWQTYWYRLGWPAWAIGTKSVKGEPVNHGGRYYVCIQDHTAAAGDEPGVGANWADYWWQMNEGATNNSPIRMPSPYAIADVHDIQYAQSGDILTLTHPDYPIMELRRYGAGDWRLVTWSGGASLASPNLLTLIGSGSGHTYNYLITAISQSGEETPPGTGFGVTVGSPVGPTYPIPMTWDTVPNAVGYRVYRSYNTTTDYQLVAETTGAYASAVSRSFSDTTSTPDASVTVPALPSVFASAGEYPGTVGYAQQRQWFAGMGNRPYGAKASVVGGFRNFLNHVPVQDDDALAFDIASQSVDAIRHIVSLRRPVILTEGSEWMVGGDVDGVIRPTAIGLEWLGDNGAASVRPAVCDSDCLYVQARGRNVRALQYSRESDGYGSLDLSVYSAHLFQDFQITRWAYAKIPHSIVWAVRSDGALVAITYNPEQSMAAWHRHDLAGGTVEDVMVLPGIDAAENDDSVFLVVTRTIDGVQRRYVERMMPRIPTGFFNSLGGASDIEGLATVRDMVFVDSALTIDLRIYESAGIPVTLTGGTTWTAGEDMTITGSITACARLYAGSVQGGTECVLYADGEAPLRLEITDASGYLGGSIDVRPLADVETAYRNVALGRWDYTYGKVPGLYHLEGETVAILADGNNHSQQTVASGEVTLDAPYTVIHAGMPITAELETLDLESLDQSILLKKKRVAKVGAQFYQTRGATLGIEGDKMQEPPWEDPGDNEEPPLFSGIKEIHTPSKWERAGRVLVRQTYPWPCTVMNIITTGEAQR